MAINANVGLQGSGKSFEVVSSVIIPAIHQGRNVVTNIDGVNSDLIRQYLVEEKKADINKLGVVRHVKNEDVTTEGFFPREEIDSPSIVQKGDLVAIDECWRFWGNEHKISEEHMEFFRMHRHYCHPDTGVSCDISLMIQDMGSLHRKIRNVVELTVRTVKLKAIGAPTAYRVELYEGHKITKLTRIDVIVKKYDKKIFPLYKSYAAGAGKETAIDKRQNVLANPRLWFMVALFLLLGASGVYFTLRFFNPKTTPLATAKTDGSKAQDVQPGQPVATGSVPRQPVQQPVEQSSQAWRLSGTVLIGDQSFYVLVSDTGRIRYESPSMFSGPGRMAVGLIDGSRVTYYSGVSDNKVTK